MNKSIINRNNESKSFLKFFIPSLIGVLIFLVPISINGKVNLIVNIIIDKTKEMVGGALIPFVILILGVSAVFSFISLFNKNLFKGYWKDIFQVKASQVAIRVAAFIMSILIYFKLGPEFIWSKNTGGLMLYDVVANLVPFFFWAGLFLPLLTQFGLMEFVGSLARPIMRPLFKIPGRSAINCAVAWVGSGTMGIVLTNKEFEDGFYTKREAISIATGFAVASIAIVSLLTGFLDMTPYFPAIYITSIVVGFIINAIMVRIPPISLKDNEYFEGAPKRDVDERIPDNYSPLEYSLMTAVNRANEKKSNLIKSGLEVTGDVWFTLEPVVLFIGTIATIIAEYTPLFKIISTPLKYVITFLRLPEAAAAAEAIMLGFIDIFLPFIFGGSIQALSTKFVLAVVGILQIIFITETGALLLKLKMDIKFKDIVLIFLLRTLLALVIVTPIAYILF